MKKSLSVWSGLTKAVEKDYRTIADMVVKAKSPSAAWEMLNSMIEDDESEFARDEARMELKRLR